MSLNTIDKEYFENLREVLFDTIDESVWIYEVNKSKMKCVLRHFFDINDFNDFGSYEFDEDEFDEYYKDHHIKYTSELRYKTLREYIKNDS